jgi:hypothetical protein
MPTPFLSMIDPTLLSGVRDHLAATFAARIGDAIDEVSGFIEFESELIADAAERRALESAGRLQHANRAASKPAWHGTSPPASMSLSIPPGRAAASASCAPMCSNWFRTTSWRRTSPSCIAAIA